MTSNNERGVTGNSEVGVTRDNERGVTSNNERGVTSNSEQGIRKRTYTISSGPRESQLGDIPDIKKNSIRMNNRSKSESGGVKKVNVSSSSASKIRGPTHEKHSQLAHPDIKFVFCGQTLDLDNVSIADSAFTRMESIRVFLESHLGYELFVKAYECVKRVSAWEKEMAVFRLVTEILGGHNIKYFPVLIQLVTFESIYYS